MSNDLHIRLLPDGTNARVDAAARAYANVAGIGGTIADRRRAWLLATLAQDEAAVKALAHVAAVKTPSKKLARPAVTRGKSPTTEGMQALGRYLNKQTRISEDVRHTRYQAGYSALFVVETEVPPVSMDAITRRTGLCERAAARAMADLCAAGVAVDHNVAIAEMVGDCDIGASGCAVVAIKGGIIDNLEVDASGTANVGVFAASCDEAGLEASGMARITVARVKNAASRRTSGMAQIAVARTG